MGECEQSEVREALLERVKIQGAREHATRGGNLVRPLSFFFFFLRG